MIRSYDFIIHAYRVKEFREEIIRHINLQSDSEIIFDNAIIKFDGKNKLIEEYPNSGVFLSDKIIPIKLSYDAFFEIMGSKEPLLVCEKECRFIGKTQRAE